MEEVKLKRGKSEVNFKKLPGYFAMRLKQGRATDEKILEASVGRPKTDVKHIDSDTNENLEIFTVKEISELEETMDEMRKAPASDVVTHMYTMSDTEDAPVIPTGTMTVCFKSNVTKKKKEEILGEFGLEILEDLDFLPNGFTVRLTDASKENPLKIAQKLQSKEDIETAEPDLSFSISFKSIPTDPYYRWQWHLNNRGDRVGLKEGADVKAEDAWKITKGSRDIVICVMDDGFDLNHPDFSAIEKIVAPRDFGQDDFDSNPVFKDDNHGTACAGVAIAEENGSGVVGLAPRCSLMPIRTSGRLSDQAVVELFQYAIAHNADVISCSWTAAAWNFPLSTIINGIIHKAATEGRRNKKGCVILFASGNENRPLNGEKYGRISHQGFGLHPDVIAVAASNSLDKRSSYSNYGPEIAISAPSSGSPGRKIVTTDRRGVKGYSSGDYTFDFGGTSSSTPLAAGLSALILSVNPDLTSAEVKQIIMETADKIDVDKGDYVDDHSPYFGHGRVNAHKAVTQALGDKLPKVLFMEHRVNTPIPDFGKTKDGITFPLDVPIRDIAVSMEIKHTWSGDLRVSLKPPEGDEIILQDRLGGNEDDIIKTFRSSSEPVLFQSVIEQSAKGDWLLKIEDLAKQDVGVISKWGLAITY